MKGWTLWRLYVVTDCGDDLCGEYDSRREAVEAALRLDEDEAHIIEESTVYEDGSQSGRRIHDSERGDCMPYRG